MAIKNKSESLAMSILFSLYFIFEFIKSFQNGQLYPQLYIYGVYILLLICIMVVEIIRRKKGIFQKQNYFPSLPVLIFLMSGGLNQNIIAFHWRDLFFLIGVLLQLVFEVPAWLFPSKTLLKKRTAIIIFVISIVFMLISIIWALVLVLKK